MHPLTQNTVDLIEMRDRFTARGQCAMDCIPDAGSGEAARLRQLARDCLDEAAALSMEIHTLNGFGV